MQGQKRTKKVQAHLTASEHAKLVIDGQSNGLSPSEYMRCILVLALKEKPVLIRMVGGNDD